MFGYVNVKQGAAAAKRKLPKNASGNEMWNSAQQASAKKISEPSLRCEFVCIQNKLCQINISETAWYPRIIQNCAHETKPWTLQSTSDGHKIITTKEQI